MSEAKPQQEPSMEEILASIRRIISEDGEPGAEAAEAPQPAADAGEGEDVLELTEVVDEEPAAEEEEAPSEPEVAEAAEEPAEAEEEEFPGPPEEPDDDALPRENDEIELREEEMRQAAAAAEASAAPPEGSALISDDPAAAASGSLSSLVAAVDQAHAGTPIGQAGRTIEDLVKEVLRPMIREWLDANLPGLVERLVAREIARLSRHAEGDD